MDFVQEGKVDEERKRRQAEWERVRKKDDPIEAPPEVFDNRTLYDRLKEQHEMKKKEFEDQFSLKNQIKGLDKEEVDFLAEIDEMRIKREREMRMEEKKELEEVKKAKVGALSSISSDAPKITLTLPTHKKENKQADLLSSLVINKRKNTSNTSNTSNSGSTSTSTLITSTNASFSRITESDSEGEDSDDESKNKKFKKSKKPTPPTQIVLGILPGIGEYDSNSSSLSEESTDDDEDDCDERNLDTSAMLTRGSSGSSAASKLNR